MEQMADVILAIGAAMAAISTLARIITALTPTPADDEALDRFTRLWAKLYPALEAVAITTRRTKESPGQAAAVKRVEQEDYAENDGYLARIMDKEITLEVADKILGKALGRDEKP